jgi:hypothetical protein
MSRRTAGEELQQLFRDHDAERVSEEEFLRRKAWILHHSGCRLTVPLPGLPTRCMRALADFVVPSGQRS